MGKDLAKELPGAGVLRGAFDRFVEWADGEGMRATAPWLTAAMLTAVACEITRRQVRRARGQEAKVAPVTGTWFPDSAGPLPGDAP